MKKVYPNYREIGVQSIEDNLSKKDKKILQDFLNFVGMTAGKTKLNQYRIYMLQFRDVIEKDLDKITKEDSEEFWRVVNHDETREVFTKNQIRMIVKRFLKWFYKDIEMIENLHTQKYLTNFKKFNKSNLITKEELEKLLRGCNNFRDKSIITILWESAGRPEEIRNLTWNKIDFQNKTVKLFSNKTKTPREIPLDKSIDRLEEWKQDYFFPNVKDSDFCFPSERDRSKPLTESFFTQLIKRICKRVGIRKITPYDFRRTRLTELYIDKKVPDLIHRKFSGHTPDSKMTSVYVKLDENDMKETIQGLYNVKKKKLKKGEKEELLQLIHEQDEKIIGVKEYLKEMSMIMLQQQKAINENPKLKKEMKKVKIVIPKKFTF